MLMFKKKFLDDIRSGRKTQTLRFWKRLRIHADQKNFIPGVGPVWIDSVDEVFFDDLTDKDARPDGFSTIEDLKQEIRNIYGMNPEGKLYRIRFHLLPPDSLPDSTPKFLAVGKEEKLLHGKKRPSSTSAPRKTDPASKDFDSLAKTSQTKMSQTKTSIRRPEKIKRKVKFQADKSGDAYRKFAYQIKLDVKKQLDDWDASAIHRFKRSKDPGNQNVEKKELLTEEQVVEKMIRRCRINRNVCDWNHEPGKSQDFFALFLQAPRNEKGVPTLDGYRLRSLMRDQLSENQWEEICWIAAEICAAWTEWQYAVEHWKINGES